jgi:hypothetical protein
MAWCSICCAGQHAALLGPPPTLPLPSAPHTLPPCRTEDLAISFVYNYYPMLSSIAQTAGHLATLYTDASVR